MTSHGYNSGSLQGDFFTQGTGDFTPIYSVCKAIEYYNSIGGMVRFLKHPRAPPPLELHIVTL